MTTDVELMPPTAYSWQQDPWYLEDPDQLGPVNTI
jgi:hypothetical protein